MSNVYHLGLCMAGSISAGAYTAGVMDYLIEALNAWEEAKKKDGSVPQHQVVIDLLCGASGGGITAAMSLFAMHDQMDHVQLQSDGINYTKPKNNILWDCWVELDGGNTFMQMLIPDDLNRGHVPSGFNSQFIDRVADKFRNYMNHLVEMKPSKPGWMGIEPELFLTLFNLTGINYRLFSKSIRNGKLEQKVTDHRDIAHFRLTEKEYSGDGRMCISLRDHRYHDTIVDAAKATGAFPVGLRARLLSRDARYIYDNPFFNKGEDGRKMIDLGKAVQNGMYTSLNSDGGTANNEPVEHARRLLLEMHAKQYGSMHLTKDPAHMDGAEKAAALKNMHNTSVLLIDPFPSSGKGIKMPDPKDDHLTKYMPGMVMSLHSQLIFDAKESLDAYKKGNYGLHVIAPSRDDVDPAHAIACASVGGFGGFLEREFRVHDYFLGRHNCQSFLRKYFVAKRDEQPGSEDYHCVEAVINAYKENPAAMNRFAFQDEDNVWWLPIIPDVSMEKPLLAKKTGEQISYESENELPVYKLKPLAANFLEKNYGRLIVKRSRKLALSMLPNAFMRLFAGLASFIWASKIKKAVIDFLKKDLLKRGLIEG